VWTVGAALLAAPQLARTQRPASVHSAHAIPKHSPHAGKPRRKRLFTGQRYARSGATLLVFCGEEQRAV